MTPEELKDKIDGPKLAAIERLRDGLSPVVASISSREAFSNVANHFGTGSFCRWKDRVFLLSNAHVPGRVDLTLGVALKSGAEMHTLSGDAVAARNPRLQCRSPQASRHPQSSEYPQCVPPTLLAGPPIPRRKA